MAIKPRHIPGIEALEVRDTPDVSLGSAAYPLAPSAGVPGHTAPLEPSAPRLDLPGVLGRTEDLLSLPALEALFAAPEDLERLLAAPEPDGSSSSTRDSEFQGWRFLSNYTRKAIRNEELRRGGLGDPEDLVQQVFVEWWEQVGPRSQAFTALLNRDSPEHFVLRKTVRRVLDHARYEQTRDRRMDALRDQPAPVRPAEEDWLDLRLDWESGAGGTGPRERQMLELRRQGMTFEEIGAELGLLKQRVCELYNAAVGRLQEQYSDGE